MKIEFTKEQYENLLRLCYMGNWVANAQRDGSKDDPMVEKYDNIYDYIQSFAPDFGLNELVKFDKETNQYYATRKFDETGDMHELINEYDENSFWDDLIDRLTDRDFDRTYTQKEREKMTFEEFLTKRQPFEDKWNKEISSNGIERLDIPNAK